MEQMRMTQNNKRQYGAEPSTYQHPQTRELISGPSLTVNTRLLSFSRMQSWVFAGLLTGYNILRRHILHNAAESALSRTWAA